MVVEIVVIGAGGFGREALDVIEAQYRASGEPYRILGVADDHLAPHHGERLTARGISHLGSVAEVIATLEPVHYVLGIGHPGIRRTLDLRLVAAGWSPLSVVHPSAQLGSRVVIGDGAVICGGVQLSTNTRLGRQVHLNPNATIGHDAQLGDYVSVNPGGIVSGEVTLGSGVLLGAGAVILQGLAAGADAVIGAAACVTRDVAAGTVVIGVPARPLPSTGAPRQ